MGKVQQIDHPLTRFHLTKVRDKNTNPQAFRHAVSQLSALVAFEATRELETAEYQVETPLTQCAGFQWANSIGLVPILRAGIGMVDSVLNFIPDAQVWHLGLYRDEATAKPVGYYNKLPSGSPVSLAMVLDPMLATGGSACLACETLKEWGVDRIQILSIISAPEGTQEVQARFPDVDIHTCVIDERLNENKFIVPGLGDAGDRIFNT